MNCESNTESSIEKLLKSIPGVIESKATYGVYDMVVKVEAKTDRMLKEIISQIRKIRNISHTITMKTTS